MTAQAIPYRRRRAKTGTRQARGRGPSIAPMVLFVGAVIAVFFSMIYLRVSLDETAFELAELESGIRNEQSRQLDLRFDLAGLKDPVRVVSEAERIGMVYPDERVTIVVDRISPDPQVLEPEVPIRALNGSGS